MDETSLGRKENEAWEGQGRQKGIRRDKRGSEGTRKDREGQKRAIRKSQERQKKAIMGTKYNTKNILITRQASTRSKRTRNHKDKEGSRGIGIGIFGGRGVAIDLA